MTTHGLVSPNTPTLASPIPGFTTKTNTPAIQTVPDVVSSETQTTDEEVLGSLPLGHDISRISLRPQAKLSVGQPGDMYEQEADMMASRVMSMSLPTVQREAMPEEEEEDLLQPKFLNASIQRYILPEEVQTKRWDALPLQRATDSNFQAGGNVESRLNSSKGEGSPLPNEVRGFMEPRFGHDFRGVRVHTGGDAVQMNRELGAQAFAHGSDIYFGAGKSPGNNELTAHELTHVVQQTGAVQRKCSECEKEEVEVQRSPLEISAVSASEIQRWSLFGDEEDKTKTKSKKCSDKVVEELNKEMHEFYNKNRSCSQQLDTCESATAKVAAGYGAFDGRVKLQQKCFSPGDDGYEEHMKKIAETNKTLQVCLKVMSEKCNK